MWYGANALIRFPPTIILFGSNTDKLVVVIVLSVLVDDICLLAGEWWKGAWRNGLVLSIIKEELFWLLCSSNIKSK